MLYDYKNIPSGILVTDHARFEERRMTIQGMSNQLLRNIELHT